MTVLTRHLYVFIFGCEERIVRVEEILKFGHRISCCSGVPAAILKDVIHFLCFYERR